NRRPRRRSASRARSSTSGCAGMDSSRAILSTVEADVRAIADVEAFGLVFPVDDDRATLLTRHRTGASGHRFTYDRIPPTMRPTGAPPSVVQIESLTDPTQVFVQRLAMYKVANILALPAGAGVFWAGTASGRSFAQGEIDAFVALASRLATALAAAEPRSVSMTRLSRLERVDAMVPLL